MRRWLSRSGSDAPSSTPKAPQPLHDNAVTNNPRKQPWYVCIEARTGASNLPIPPPRKPPGDRTIISRQRRRRRQTHQPCLDHVPDNAVKDTRRDPSNPSNTTNHQQLHHTNHHHYSHGPQPKSRAFLVRRDEHLASTRWAPFPTTANHNSGTAPIF